MRFQRGAGLVQVMLVGSVIATLLLVVTRYAVDIQKQGKQQQLRTDVLSLHEEITSTLKNKEACQATFNPDAIAPNRFSNANLAQFVDQSDSSSTYQVLNLANFDSGVPISSVINESRQEVFTTDGNTVRGYPEIRINSMRAFYSNQSNITGESVGSGRAHRMYLAIEYQKVQIGSPDETASSGGTLTQRKYVTLQAVLDTSGNVVECYVPNEHANRDAVRNSCVGIGVVLDQSGDFIRCVHLPVDLRTDRPSDATEVSGRAANTFGSNAIGGHSVDNVCPKGQYINRLEIVNTVGGAATTMLNTGNGFAQVYQPSSTPDYSGVLKDPTDRSRNLTYNQSAAQLQNGGFFHYRFYCAPISIAGQCPAGEVLYRINETTSSPICTAGYDPDFCYSSGGVDRMAIYVGGYGDNPPRRKCVGIDTTPRDASQGHHTLLPVLATLGVPGGGNQSVLDQFVYGPIMACDGNTIVGFTDVDGDGDTESVCAPYPYKSPCPNAGDYLVEIKDTGEPICKPLPREYKTACPAGYYLKGFDLQKDSTNFPNTPYDASNVRQICKPFPKCPPGEVYVGPQTPMDTDNPGFEQSACRKFGNLCGTNQYAAGIANFSTICRTGNKVCKDPRNGEMQIVPLDQPCPSYSIFRTGAFCPVCQPGETPTTCTFNGLVWQGTCLKEWDDMGVKLL